MKKLQQFYIMKFTSTRVAKFNYSLSKRTLCDVSKDIKTIRQNGELIALADNQALRTIREIRYQRESDIIRYDPVELEKLNNEKREIKRGKFTPEARKRISIINNRIDEMLFMPEYVSVVIEDVNHYRYIIKHGLYINNFKYVRLMCSAGQARVNTVILIREDYEEETKRRLKCGARDVKITKNKYNAYFALSSSATYNIPKPNVYLINDCEMEMDKTVDWISKIPEDQKNSLSNNEKVSTETKTLGFNFFDGCGAVSPEFAQRVADELELDYLPAAFCVRCAYVKGMVFVIDFKKYAREHNISTVIDMYGDEINIMNTDIILTKSQFKLWNGYDHMSDVEGKYPNDIVYDNECEKYGFNWGVTKITPKVDDDYFMSNYQFCQAIKFSPEQLSELCDPTVEWLKGIAGDDVNKSILFLANKLCSNPDTDFQNILNLTGDNIAKALIVNPAMIQEEYIRSNIIMSINKKIRESYLGKLILHGNFSVMIPDMYAFMQHTFGHEVIGLLGHPRENKHYYYSHYWNQKGKDEIVAMRSPLTWRSEVNKLTLRNDEQTREWFQYLTSGIVYNIWECDCIIHADSDFDGDIVATTDNKVFLESRDGSSLPITYNKSTVDKEFIKEKDLYKADIQSFNSTIGQITNISTSFYEILAAYEGQPGKEKYEAEILERLKLIRKSQGDAIDKAKGIKIEPMPKHWTKKVRRKPDDVTQEEFDFCNEIVADRKPYFFRYLYPKENAKYLEYVRKENIFCRKKFGKTVDELFSAGWENLNEEETVYLEEHFRRNLPLIDCNGRMNQICHYMENNLKEIPKYRKMKTQKEIIDLMMSDPSTVFPEDDIEYMNSQYLRYKSEKARSRADKINSSAESMNPVDFNAFMKDMKKEIYDRFSSDIEYITDLAIYVSYSINKSRTKDFCWSLFGNQIVRNIKKNTNAPMRVPAICEDGEIEYMGKKYTVIEVEEENDNSI